MRWPRFLRPRRSAGPLESADDVGAQRERMVTQHIEARGITDPDLLRAFRAVERHTFVEGPAPYGDHALPVGAGQTISQPYVVAVMTDVARPASGWVDAAVLEVGTGSGYQAALLAELGARVTSIERHPELAEGARERLRSAGYGHAVDVVVGDGTRGWPDRGPYRSIIVTAGGPSVPEPLRAQLDPDGGRLVMPVGSRGHQVLTLVERHGEDFTTTELESVVFVPLIGEHGFAPESSEG